MAVRHDKCRAPSLFLRSRGVARAANAIAMSNQARITTQWPAADHGTGRGNGRYQCGVVVSSGDFRVRDRSQGWSDQRCGAIRWPSCSFASQARWE